MTIRFLNIQDKMVWVCGLFAALGVAALPISTSITDIGFIGAAVFGLIGGRKVDWQRFLSEPAILVILGFFLLLVLGMTYSSVGLHDSFKTLKKYFPLLFAILMMPGLSDDRWHNKIWWVFVGALVFTLVLSYLQLTKVVDFHFLSRRANIGSASVFRAYTHAAFLMIFGALFSSVKAFKSKGNVKWAWYFLSALFALNVMLSDARSSYVLIVLVFALWMFRCWGWKGVAISLLAGIVGIGSLYSVSMHFRGRIGQISTDISRYQKGEHQTSVGIRYTFAKNSVEIIKKNPVIGTGTGSFHHEYSKLGQRLQSDNPHNEYLHVGVMLGGVGILALLAMYGTIFYRASFLPWSESVIVQAAVVALAVGCLQDSWLMSSAEGHFFPFWVAWAFSYGRK